MFAGDGKDLFFCIIKQRLDFFLWVVALTGQLVTS
jgi:hypothetical protein